MTKNVAFIGLGVMGSPMASNILKGNYPVKAWNRTQNRPLVEQAAKSGVTLTNTIAEAVKEADYICICVSDVEDVKSVLFGEDGITKLAKNNALIIDFSTIGTAAARDLASQLKSNNFRFLDAPISGGDIGAQQGTLTIMVGGEKTDFEEALPLLETMGKKIFYCGSSGNGQAVKLCNQVLCSLNMIGLCEAIQMAEQLKIDPHLMIEVCSSGAAGSWALSNLGSKIVESNFEPGFMIKHILKDLRLVQENLPDQDLELPGVKLANQLFKIVQEMNGSEQGTQAMIRAYQAGNVLSSAIKNNS